MKEPLNLVFAETARGTHNFLYCYIKVERKRAEQVEKIFAEYDKEVLDGMRIKLTNLPCEPAMIGFGRGNEYANHVIYKEIKELQRKGDPSYKLWTPVISSAQAERARMALYQQNAYVQDRVMDEDPAAFGLDQEEDESMDEDSDDDDNPVIVVTPPVVPPAIFRSSAPPRPVEPVFDQQTRIESFFKRTEERLDKIIADNHGNSSSITGSFSSVGGDLKISHDKLDEVKQSVSDLTGIVVEKQKEFSELMNSRDHFESMTFRLRGQLGAQAAQDNKPFHNEIASLKRKLEAKDKTIEARDKRFGERLESIEEFLDGVEASQTEIKASQKLINEKLDKLLSRR